MHMNLFSGGLSVCVNVFTLQPQAHGTLFETVDLTHTQHSNIPQEQCGSATVPLQLDLLLSFLFQYYHFII